MRLKASVLAAAIAYATMAAGSATIVGAQDTDLPAAIALGPGSVLWIEGKSNLHDFENRSTAMTVKFARRPGTSVPKTAEELEAFLRASGVRSLDVEVPVQSLRSSKASLDKNLWKDLRADSFPAIRFHLSHYTVDSKASKSDTIAIRADGNLTVAGRARPVSLAGRAHRADRGVWLEGAQTLRMTDFGIKPRTMMLGTLRVKDELSVHYKLLLVPGGSK